MNVNYDVDTIDAGLEAELEYNLFWISGDFVWRSNNTDNSTSETYSVQVEWVFYAWWNQHLWYSIQVYSDFILDKNPITVEEAMKTYEKIVENAGNFDNRYMYASPMEVQLTPLNFVRILSFPCHFLCFKVLFYLAVCWCKKIKWGWQRSDPKCSEHKKEIIGEPGYPDIP